MLAPDGRLAIRVSRALEGQPFYVALIEALDRYVHVGAGDLIQAVFKLSRADALLRQRFGAVESPFRISTL